MAIGEDVVSKRTDKQLQKLKNNILELIKEINYAEEKDNFPALETKCDWCGFWQHCPKKKHLFRLEKLPKNEYLKESGVKLANKYIALARKKSEINKQAKTEAAVIEEEMEKVEEAILRYAEKHQLETLQRENSLVAINKTKDYSFPTKTGSPERYGELESLLKKTKYWDDVSTINSTKLEQLLENDALEDKLKKEIIKLAPLEEKVSLSVRKSDKK